MSSAVVALVLTLTTWLGWALVIRAAILTGRVWFRAIGYDASATIRGAALAGASGGLLLLIGAQTMRSPSGEFRVPLVWLVMPAQAWLALASACLCGLFVHGAIGSITVEQRKRKLRTAIGWALAAIGFLAWHSKTGDAVHVLRGGIPVSWGAAIAIIVLGMAAVLAMTWASQAARARQIATGIVTQLMLLAGSVVFGIPFAWLLITSFKEDRDMVSVSGPIWVPKVQTVVPYRDEQNPFFETEYKGGRVYGAILETAADGRVRFFVERPAVLRGMIFDTERRRLNVVPKEAPVVTSRYRGTPVRGIVVEDLEDGTRRVQITEPRSMIGVRFLARPDEVPPVRKVGLRWQNYPEALEYLPAETLYGLAYLKNTLIIAILSVVGTVLSSAIVAYGFSRMKFPGQATLFKVLLATMMLPAAVTMMPNFLIFRWLGWVDTLLPLWVPAFFAGAFNVFLLRQFFKTVPAELEDAAKIDGCSYFATFWRVMMPQVKPALAAIAVWTFMGAWNNFMGPLIFINSPENMPISYAVQMFQGLRQAEQGLLMAFATMAMLPVLLLFFFAQKYFIENVTLTGFGGR